MAWASLPRPNAYGQRNIAAILDFCADTDLRTVHEGRDGLVFLRTSIRMNAAGRGLLLYGADGPTKVWVIEKPVGVAPKAVNPMRRDSYTARVDWKEGVNQVFFAVNTNCGMVWGVAARGAWNRD